MADHSPAPWSMEEISIYTINILDMNGEIITSIINEHTLNDIDRLNAKAIVNYVNSCAETLNGKDN